MKAKFLIVLIILFWSLPISAQEVGTAWVSRADGIGATHDVGWATAVDEWGNVYVTGYRVNGAMSSDCLTIKYHPNGDTAWVRTYDGPARSHDMGVDLAVDGSGNVYVAGASWGLGTDAHFTTMKYLPTGETAWVRRYSGPDGSYDFAFAIALDDSGNVYVTGESSGSGTDQDYLTIKYYSNGDTAWVRRYDGPASSSDGAGDIAVDDSGNVFVTGASWGLGTESDYATIKYYPNGDTAWVRRYNGPASSHDGARAIAVDGSGNVCVTGSSWGSGTPGDYATIKYYPDGDTAWVRRYQGPGSSHDVARAIAVDDSGSVFVTGESGGSGASAWARRHDGPGNSWDYARALRIDESGNVYVPGESGGSGASAWVRRHDGPGYPWDYARALGIDGSGNVYGPGGTRGLGTDADFATIKYYANGDTAWVRRYNGPGNAEDQASALGVDGSGNVYVTGRSESLGTDVDFATIKYYPDGDTAWVRRYDGPAGSSDEALAMAVDGSGGIYVTGTSLGLGTAFDCATIKYFSNGDTAWIKRYGSLGSCLDWATALAVDGSGNVYVTGGSLHAGLDGDYLTVMYYSNGDTAWTRRYDGPASYDDAALAIAVDGSGNVYVTGGSHGLGTDLDFLTIKYYPDGDTAWVKRYNGPGDSTDYGTSIAVDESGNIYVTGGSYGLGTGNDFATIKYYPNGDTAWVRTYDGPGNTEDQAHALAVDGSGNVYVTGRSEGLGTDVDFATIKYYPGGDTAWVRRYDGPGDFDYPFAIAIDDSGNVYVTGESRSADGVSTDCATIKYYPNGDTAWVRRYDGPGSSRDAASDLAVDDSGNVYVTGYSHDLGMLDRDYVTIKYYPNGDTAWVRKYNGPEDARDQALAIAVDDWSNVYVTGSSGLEAYQDYATIKYCSDGESVWVARYNGPADSSDMALAMALDDSGNVYVTGGSMGRGTGFDYATVKYYQLNRPPDAFPLLFPQHKAFTPRKVPFDWEDTADPDACDQMGGYDLYISTSNYFNPESTTVHSDLSESEYFSTFDYGRYFWKVKAKDNHGAARSSQTRFFMVTGIFCSLGDFNKDGAIDVGDVVFAVNYLCRSGTAPEPSELGDVNCDDLVDLGDVVFLINYLFRNGPLPSC